MFIGGNNKTISPVEEQHLLALQTDDVTIIPRNSFTYFTKTKEKPVIFTTEDVSDELEEKYIVKKVNKEDTLMNALMSIDPKIRGKLWRRKELPRM